MLEFERYLGPTLAANKGIISFGTVGVTKGDVDFAGRIFFQPTVWSGTDLWVLVPVIHLAPIGRVMTLAEVKTIRSRFYALTRQNRDLIAGTVEGAAVLQALAQDKPLPEGRALEQFEVYVALAEMGDAEARLKTEPEAFVRDGEIVSLEGEPDE